jgi:hypothetical protein
MSDFLRTKRVNIQSSNDIPEENIEFNTGTSAELYQPFGSVGAGVSHSHKINIQALYNTIRPSIARLIRTVMNDEAGNLPRRASVDMGNGKFYVARNEVVLGQLAGKPVYLEFTPQKDISAYDLYMCRKANGPLLDGNAVQYIVDNDLLRHFTEVSLGEVYIGDKIRVYNPTAYTALGDQL